jgi:hypothetical protein
MMDGARGAAAERKASIPTRRRRRRGSEEIEAGPVKGIEEGKEEEGQNKKRGRRWRR